MDNLKEYVYSMRDYYRSQELASYKRIYARIRELNGKDYAEIDKEAKDLTNAMYQFFPRGINPTKNIAVKLVFVLWNSFLYMIPIINIFAFKKYFNLLLKKVKLNPFKRVESKTVNYNRDKRFKRGYRNSFRYNVTKYLPNESVPFWQLEDFEINHNRNWFFILSVPIIFILVLYFAASPDFSLLGMILIFIAIGFALSILENSMNSEGKSSKFIFANFTGAYEIEEQNYTEIDENEFGDDVVIVSNNMSTYPEEYRYYKKQLSKWFYEEGDIVQKGNPLFSISIETDKGEKIDAQAKSPIRGRLLKIIPNYSFLKDNQNCCAIEKISDKEYDKLKYCFEANREKEVKKGNEIEYCYRDGSKIDKELKVIIKEVTDEFNGKKIIASLGFTTYDSTRNKKLSFNFLYEEDNIKLLFKTHHKYFKHNIGDKLYFAFENGDNLVFELIEKGIKTDKDSDGVIYTSKIILQKLELEKFANQVFKKWKLESDKDKIEIIGGNYYRGMEEQLRRRIILEAKSILDVIKDKR